MYHVALMDKYKLKRQQRQLMPFSASMTLGKYRLSLSLFPNCRLGKLRIFYFYISRKHTRNCEATAEYCNDSM